MARISELHYSDAYAASSGVAEFLEVALSGSDNPADFTVSFYHADGTVGLEVALDHPDVSVTLDPETGELVHVISATYFDVLLTDPDGHNANNYEAYALTDTATGETLDFYDIGGGTTGILAVDGVAAGAVSTNLVAITGPSATTTTLQFNQPNTDTLVYDALGPGDTGLACFTSGTLVETPTGLRRVETLRAGDLVLTLDDGFVPVRWAGQNTVRGHGDFAPVRIRKGTLGAECDILVSPQHRLLVSGWMAELNLGESEVLAAAKMLVNGTTIQQQPCDIVTYVHIMFDDHQLLTTSGLISESFLPGAEGMKGWTSEMAQEIFALFPELRHDAVARPPAARMICRAHEATMLAVV